MNKMDENKINDPKLTRIIKIWVSLTILLIRKIKKQCSNCKLDKCGTCKYVKINSLLEEIETIFEEDNFVGEYFENLEQIAVIFSNKDDVQP